MVENNLVWMALDIISKNKEVLVAKFIIDNPDVLAEQIELVQQNNGSDIIFSVRKKTY